MYFETGDESAFDSMDHPEVLRRFAHYVTPSSSQASEKISSFSAPEGPRLRMDPEEDLKAKEGKFPVYVTAAARSPAPLVADIVV